MSIAIVCLTAALVVQSWRIYDLRSDMDCLIRSLPVDQLKNFVREYEKGKRKCK